ncbi:MAG: 4-hydroxythreonine-4-phosphate dehydrogenase PdxA, partial [Cyanobacteria bacterium J06650_10]
MPSAFSTLPQQSQNNRHAPPAKSIDAKATQIKPRLVMTLGDPAGIGPEVVLKTLSKHLEQPKLEPAAEITVIGDRTLLQNAYDQIKAARPNLALIHPGQLNFIDIAVPASVSSGVTKGKGKSNSGEVAFKTIRRAIAHTVKGEIDGIVTAPI